MKTIRSEHIRKTARNRECYNCGMTIKKGEKYLNREIRYDGMGVIDEAKEADMWRIYSSHAPEMKKLIAAIKNTDAK